MTSRDPRPRHQQIAAELRAAILSGDLAPSSKLESTAKLMQRYATANQTVQNALMMLKAEGFIEGQPGRGVFVRQHVPQVVVANSYKTPAGVEQPYSWLVEAAQRGQAGATKLLDVTEVKPPHEVAAAFGIADSPDAITVQRSLIMMLDDEPAELVHSYYPIELARDTDLAKRRRIRGGTPRVFADMGLIPVQTVDQISARPPTSAEFEHLALPSEVPILRTFRVVYTDGLRPIEATVMIKAAHMYTLEYRV